VWAVHCVAKRLDNRQAGVIQLEVSFVDWEKAFVARIVNTAATE
jgi:hypothetical protein